MPKAVRREFCRRAKCANHKRFISGDTNTNKGGEGNDNPFPLSRLGLQRVTKPVDRRGMETAVHLFTRGDMASPAAQKREWQERNTDIPLRFHLDIDMEI